MSRAGKLFRYIPGAAGWLLPPSGIRSRFRHGKAMVGTFSGRGWHHCPQCDLGWVHPMPSEETLDRYYAQAYWDVRTPRDLMALARTPGNLERPRRQLDFIRGAGVEKCGAALDFGAGMCGGALTFQESGFARRVSVFDNSRQTRILAEGLGLEFVGDPGACDDGAFDLLYTSHVVEHVSSLQGTLALFRHLVAAGGHVFIEVPNVPDVRALRALHHAPHTLAFSGKALTAAMAAAGFDEVGRKEYEPPYDTDPSAPWLNVPRCLMGLYVKR